MEKRTQPGGFEYFPAFLDLRGRRCVVVGGGNVAERKVEALLACAAEVTIVSPHVTSRIESWQSQSLLNVQPRVYRPGDLEGAFLAIAATGDEAGNREVFTEAEDRRIFCNVVDDPDSSSFIVPAVLRRGRLALAISTSGGSPALARRMREELEVIFPAQYADYLEEVISLRASIRSLVTDSVARQTVWQQLLGAGALEMLRDGRLTELDRVLSAAVAGAVHPGTAGSESLG